jgi:hypothetical protein
MTLLFLLTLLVVVFEITSTSNEPSLWGRIFYLTLAAVLIGYGVNGIRGDDLVIPFGSRQSGHTTHLRGLPATLMFSAMLCTAGVLLSTLAGHSGRSDGWQYRRLFAQVLLWISMVLATSSLFVFGYQTPSK